MQWRWSCMLVCLILVGCSTQPSEQTDPSLTMMQNLAAFKLDALGNPQIKTDSVHPVYSSVDKPHKLLIIPVAYSNLGFDRFAGEPDSAQKNRDYFQQLLFAEDLRQPRGKTMTHYFYHQSQGQYYLTGEVLNPVVVDHPSDYYGKPIQNSDGQWRNDVRAESLVEDALAQAFANNPNFPWSEFDIWDPEDYDGDQIFDEPDGYIDHFVLVFAGKGQSSCQGLYSLDEKLTTNAPSDRYKSLAPNEQECAQRIWPHRFSLTKNNGKGPKIGGLDNRRGGIPLNEHLWVYDYNMQSEYTSVSTFIHEFGHSLGLPDIYARETSNSTASWDLMSSTVGPVPQEMSTWSRMVLGWSNPCIVMPPEAGGAQTQSLHLKTMNDWQSGGSKACDAAMVVLPPKIRRLRMGPLQDAQGAWAAYTGQGNSLNHFLEREFDLSLTTSPDIALRFDTWFKIEADWDYLYVEISDDGENFLRLMPTDKSSALDHHSVMSSKRGHDGLGTIPGFTGLSGDYNGDGKVETAQNCNPLAERKPAEEQIKADAIEPCDQAQWVTAQFDLSPFKGKKIQLRFHYYSDMAAVEDGALIDNIAIPAIGFKEDFEDHLLDGWKSTGFSLSGGTHDIRVPHYYLLEYRDPEETFANGVNYDQNINEPGFTFFPGDDKYDLQALDFRYRPGVLVWYYNGSYLWSQNEPSQFGPGNGFLLLVDANPQEFRLPAVPDDYYKTDGAWHYYQFDQSAQAILKENFIDVMCNTRRPAYYPVDLSKKDKSRCETAVPRAEALSYDGRQLLYSYTLINEVLPGKEREVYEGIGSLFHYKLKNGEVQYRLYDRMLRNAHSADAPFAITPFAGGIRYFRAENSHMVPVAEDSFAPVNRFDDSSAPGYLNPHLPFGSAAVPASGFSFTLLPPDNNADATTKVKVDIKWQPDVD